MRAAGSDDFNRDSTISFDSSRCLLPLWVTCVWWFGLKLLFFSFFLFLPFFLGLCADHAKNHINLFIYFFF
jgi:hypothetical protein